MSDELPAWIPGDADDDEVVRLIDSWRYAGPPTPWEAIVGHERQIQRCQELVEKLRRTDDELERLKIRVGAGMVITGEAGVGKSLLARAIATALGGAS
jgi:ATP-dependent 26S proteasome regulatory subunit